MKWVALHKSCTTKVKNDIEILKTILLTILEDKKHGAPRGEGAVAE